MPPIKNLMSKKTNGIQVWKISISRNFQFLYTHYQSVLSMEELTKSSFFFHEKDRQSYLTRRIMIRLLLAESLECSASEIQFREGKNKKPEIAHPNTGVHFNISHSEDYILIAIAETPIGIDVEKISPNFKYRDIMDDYFTPDEQDFVLESEKDALKTFFLLWTRKEAYVKYTGEGLLGDLKGMPKVINLPDDISASGNINGPFHVQSILLDSAYWMSIIYPVSGSEIYYFEYDHRVSIWSLPWPSEA